MLALAKENFNMDCEDPKCPFNVKSILARPEGILEETQYWWVTPNQSLYENARSQILIIPKRHIVETISNFEDLEHIDLRFALKKAMEIEPAGLLSIRLGPDLGRKNGIHQVTGSTVAHLHYQWTTPVTSKTVFFHIGPEKFSTSNWTRK